VYKVLSIESVGGKNSMLFGIAEQLSCVFSS